MRFVISKGVEICDFSLLKLLISANYLLQSTYITMKNLLHLVIICCLFAFSISPMLAQPGEQDANQKMMVKMKNGEEYSGYIISKDEKTLVLRTENGDINLISENIVSIKTDNYKGKYAFENPHDSRYFFGPSGIPVKKGKGYYQNVLLLFNFANYGLTDNISIGGGLEFISTVNGQPIWFLTPKVGFSLSDNAHLSGGFIMAGLSTFGTATVAYSALTLGHSETNLSVGVGYGLFDGEFSNNPAIMLSGTHRVSNSIALISENYFFPSGSGDGGYFGIQGIRIMSKKNSFDIGGFIFPQVLGITPAFPYVAYVRVF